MENKLTASMPRHFPEEMAEAKKKTFHAHCGTSCEMTAPTDKICGNESKIRKTSQNYRFFQCIFPIFQFLRLNGMVLAQISTTSFVIVGGNVLKCNGLSKLLSVFLGPLVMFIMQ